MTCVLWQIFSYSSEDPGLLTLALQSFKFPDAVLSTGFGISEKEVKELRSIIPGYPLDVNAECRRRCRLAA